MKRRTGLFGGTFDPVHNGHISIAESFLNSGLIDELWVLLSPYPPHKLEEQRAGYTHRLEMLNMVFGEDSRVQISTVENELPKPSYTVQTVKHLKNVYPRREFFFCMGEDSLSAFHTWKYYREIIEECELIVARRPGAGHKMVEDAVLSKTHFADHDPLDISSTGIKTLVRAGKDISEMVPERVRAYIEKEHLYS